METGQATAALPAERGEGVVACYSLNRIRDSKLISSLSVWMSLLGHSFSSWQGRSRCLGHSREDNLPFDDVDTEGEGLVILAGLPPPLVGQTEGVGEGGVGQSQGGGAGHRAGDVGHGVMEYAVDGVCGVGMGRRG